MKKPKTVGRTRDGLKILDRITGNDPRLREEIGEAKVNFRVAQLIYDARTAAEMTQQQLADLVGTKQSVIARLEDADYEGHSLTMLSRIARVLHQRLEVRFVPKRARERQSAAAR
ncbi:MAG: transcriptional regulator [Acidobacteria bacterium RIFCSPLOWO2_12_FULL_65_11]|nr:MAG: transcriptional regulator [Acidobacteria bacterium RIFCSPLOWO2_02_FULL_64_15]OFW31466.1 MAG: transcriptional regulator [Acidobacteria bacterium RIFCSPLOWO2_12_FULL_65_11]